MKHDWGKGIVIIAAIAVAFWYFTSRESKQTSIQNDTYDKCVQLSEELQGIYNTCDDAIDEDDPNIKDDYLVSIRMKCDELKKIADTLADRYEERDIDYDDSRSFFR